MDSNKSIRPIESLFSDMSDLELEALLRACDIDFEKVEKGKGGFFIDGVNIRDIKDSTF